MIKVYAILDGIKTQADGTLKLTFALNETDIQGAAEILTLHRQGGWMVFSPTEAEAQIPDEPPVEFKTDKSPSQRLRAILYRLAEKQGKQKEFQPFYVSMIEKFIEWTRNKLEELEG